MKHILCLFISIVSLSSMAQVYKWVDENGKTHYSSESPYERNTILLPEINTPRGGYISKVDTKEPIAFNYITHKAIIIDDITMNVRGANPYVVNIGKNICGKNIPITWDNGRLSGSKQNLFSKAMELVFNNNNYNIKRKVKNYVNEDFLLGVKIVDINVNVCNKRELSKNYSNVKLSQATSKVKIMWTLYDKKMNKTIIEITTEGYFDGLNEPAAPDGLDFSLSESFKSATSNLLASSEFTSVIYELIRSDDRASFDNKPIQFVALDEDHESLSLQFSPVDKLGSVFKHAADLSRYNANILQSDARFQGVFLNEDGYILTPNIFDNNDGPINIEVNDILLDTELIREDKSLNVSLLKVRHTKYASTNINLKQINSVDEMLLFMVVEEQDDALYLDEVYAVVNKKEGLLSRSSSLRFNSSNIGRPLFNMNGEFLAIVVGEDSDNPGYHKVMPVASLFKEINIIPVMTSFSIDIEKNTILEKIYIVISRMAEWLNRPIMTLE